MPNKFKNMPTVQNVGIVGEGYFTPFQDGVITKEYKLWTCMLERCLSQKYKSIKEEYIKQQATKWQPQIDARVYEALMQYQVNMDD